MLRISSPQEEENHVKAIETDTAGESTLVCSFLYEGCLDTDPLYTFYIFTLLVIVSYARK